MICAYRRLVIAWCRGMNVYLYHWKRLTKTVFVLSIYLYSYVFFLRFLLLYSIFYYIFHLIGCMPSFLVVIYVNTDFTQRLDLPIFVGWSITLLIGIFRLGPIVFCISDNNCVLWPLQRVIANHVVVSILLVLLIEYMNMPIIKYAAKMNRR